MISVGHASCVVATAMAAASPAAAAAGPAPDPVEDDQAAPQRVQRRVRSVNYSHPRDGSKRAPATFTREGFAHLLAQRHTEAFEARAQAGNVPNAVKKVTVFREKHADGQYHLYAIVFCEKPYETRAIQTELQKTDKMPASFGADHEYFWTAILYGGAPSVHKGLAELDEDPQHSEGRTLREELMDIPALRVVALRRGFARRRRARR